MDLAMLSVEATDMVAVVAAEEGSAGENEKLDCCGAVRL